jgi:hypothetical protein
MTHRCEDIDAPARLYGEAISECYEEDGIFWVGNREYETAVNYCPFCGMKAPKSSKEARAALGEGK